MKDYKNIIIAVLVIVSVTFGIRLFTGDSDTPIATTPDAVYSADTQSAECITAEESWDHIGDFMCVEYFVASPYTSNKGNVFLNEKRDYKNGFTTVIFATSANNFKAPESTYGYKTIQATGLIKMYQGHPEIIANDPSQIRVK